MGTVGTASERALDDIGDEQVVALWNDSAALEDLMLDVNQSIQWIDQQLGDRDRRTPDGERMDGYAWFEWRARALGAKRHKVALYRRLKARIKELHRAEHDDTQWKERGRAIAADRDETFRRMVDALEHIEALLDERLPKAVTA